MRDEPTKEDESKLLDLSDDLHKDVVRELIRINHYLAKIQNDIHELSEDIFKKKISEDFTVGEFASYGNRLEHIHGYLEAETARIYYLYGGEDMEGEYAAAIKELK